MTASERTVTTPPQVLADFATKVRAVRFSVTRDNGRRVSVVSDIDAMVWIQEAYAAGASA